MTAMGHVACLAIMARLLQIRTPRCFDFDDGLCLQAVTRNARLGEQHDFHETMNIRYPGLGLSWLL